MLIKISEDILKSRLKNRINNLYQMDIQRKLYPTEYTVFYKLTHIFTKIDLIIDQKASLNKFLKTEISISQCYIL